MHFMHPMHLRAHEQHPQLWHGLPTSPDRATSPTAGLPLTAGCHGWTSNENHRHNQIAKERTASVAAERIRVILHARADLSICSLLMEQKFLWADWVTGD